MDTIRKANNQKWQVKLLKFPFVGVLILVVSIATILFVKMPFLN